MRAPSHLEQPPSPWKSALVILACAAALLVGVWLSTAYGADIVTPSQHGTQANSFASGASTSAVSVTLTPPAAQRVRLYSFSAYCSAGQASASVVNSTNARTLWLADAAYVTASLKQTNFQTPLTGPVGSTLVVTVASCGTGQMGNLSVQADYDTP